MTAVYSRLTLLAAGLLLLNSTATAQTNIDPSRTAAVVDPSGAQRGALLRQDVTDTFRSLQDENTFAPQSPGDQDIGQQLILKRNERNYPWHVSLDANEFWTDNAANAHKGKEQDWFFVGGATVGYQPQLTSRLYLDFSLAEHWFEYAKFGDLSFESGETSAGAILLMPELWSTVWYANYYYQRITQGLGEKAIYDTNNLRVGVQRTFLIDRSNSVTLGLQSSFCVEGDPQELRRNEYTLITGYNYKIMRELGLSFSYRLAYYDYFKADRHDFFNSLGLALVYQPTTWSEVSLSYNYTYNHSNQDSFSYESQLAGPSITFKAKF